MKTLKIDLEKLAKQYGFDVLDDVVIVDDEGRRVLVLQGDIEQ